SQAAEPTGRRSSVATSFRFVLSLSVREAVGKLNFHEMENQSLILEVESNTVRVLYRPVLHQPPFTVSFLRPQFGAGAGSMALVWHFPARFNILRLPITSASRLLLSVLFAVSPLVSASEWAGGEGCRYQELALPPAGRVHFAEVAASETGITFTYHVPEEKGA